MHICIDGCRRVVAARSCATPSSLMNPPTAHHRHSRAEPLSIARPPELGGVRYTVRRAPAGDDVLTATPACAAMCARATRALKL